MISLSLCMIVKNEEDVLGRCLNCMRDLADEIVIVDTGSTDRTKDIAAEFTQLVYDFPWCEDFSAARNFAFSKAGMDYTMWLDADDVMDEKNRMLLRQLKDELDPETDMVMMKYDVAFDSEGNTTLSYYRERLFKTARCYRWIGAIHEVIPQSGLVIYRDIRIRHEKLHPTEAGRNLRIFENMIANKENLDPRQRYYYGRELMYNEHIPKAIQVFEAFLQEGEGWLENNINACKDLARCYELSGEPEMALKSLFLSFLYDSPRAELCCDIGRILMKRFQYQSAVYWYETAASREMNSENGAFCLSDCYGYIPYIQLCVCYDRLGQREKAIEYNEKAGSLKPTDISYLYNKAYFDSHTA